MASSTAEQENGWPIRVEDDKKTAERIEEARLLHGNWAFTSASIGATTYGTPNSFSSSITLNRNTRRAGTTFNGPRSTRGSSAQARRHQARHHVTRIRASAGLHAGRTDGRNRSTIKKVTRTHRSMTTPGIVCKRAPVQNIRHPRLPAVTNYRRSEQQHHASAAHAPGRRHGSQHTSEATLYREA